MSRQTIAAGAAHPIPRERETAEFFTLNAKYLIDPASKTDDIGHDVACMLETLTATIQAVVDATTGEPVNSLVFASLYQVRQLTGMFDEYQERTSLAPQTGDTASQVRRMAEALNEGADAHHGIRATLQAMADEVYSRCSADVQGLFEAAIASTARLDRAVAVGLEAWGGQ